MAFHTIGMPSITLTTSGATSTGNVINDIVSDTYAISIVAPATLTSPGTVQIAVTSSATSYTTLQSGGTDVIIQQARAIVISPFPFKQLTLVSTSQEAAQRVFAVAQTFQS